MEQNERGIGWEPGRVTPKYPFTVNRLLGKGVARLTDGIWQSERNGDNEGQLSVTARWGIRCARRKAIGQSNTEKLQSFTQTRKTTTKCVFPLSSQQKKSEVFPSLIQIVRRKHMLVEVLKARGYHIWRDGSDVSLWRLWDCVYRSYGPRSGFS